MKKCFFCNTSSFGKKGVNYLRWVCNDCNKKYSNEEIVQRVYKPYGEKPKVTRINPKSINLEEEMETLIQIDYGRLHRVKNKVFYSKNNKLSDFEPIMKKTLEKEISSNFIHLKIEPIYNKQEIAKLISGGNFDFDDNFTKGFTLIVSLEEPEKNLMKKIVTILRQSKFGCLVSGYSAHCHLFDKNPTNIKAQNILSKVNKEIIEKI